MRVLTVQQPWAWAIFHGKDVENRTQRWGYRGPIAIHAGTRWSDRGATSPLVRQAAADDRVDFIYDPPLRGIYEQPRQDPVQPVEVLPHDRLAVGVVLGVVQLVDVHHAHPRDDGTLCCSGPWPETSYVEHGGRTRRQITHLVLEDPIEFATPITNVRGRLGLWTPDDDLADAITHRLEEAR